MSASVLFLAHPPYSTQLLISPFPSPVCAQVKCVTGNQRHDWSADVTHVVSHAPRRNQVGSSCYRFQPPACSLSSQNGFDNVAVTFPLSKHQHSEQSLHSVQQSPEASQERPAVHRR